MKTKHTPGPWLIKTNKDPLPLQPDQFAIKNFDGLHIADINTGMYDVESNAKLIAAAPDLLDGLINSKKVIESLISGNRVVNLDEAIAWYTKLIKKATE